VAQKRKVPPVLWTILCILILSFGATPFEKTVNRLLIVLRLSVLVVFSVLAVREWWKYQHRSQWNNMESDAAHNLLRRLRRWTTDDYQSAEPSATQIVGGGCYHGSPLQPPNLHQGWLIVAAVAVIVVIALLVRN
jgi:hypothetical protein